MNKSNLLILILAFLISCLPKAEERQIPRSDELKKTAEAFFQCFAERKDWDAFCAFYRTDMRFEDVSLQLQLDSLWQFKRFYNWPDTVNVFEKLSDDQAHLELSSLVVDDSTAVGRGHFNPFRYNGELIKADWGMEFTIWLYFDDDLKIKKQIDWIEYDGYTLENTIQRCRQYGHEKTPDWLDLSSPKNSLITKDTTK